MSSKPIELSPLPDDPEINYGQLALSLFEDFAPEEGSIDQAPTEIGYHRADFFLDLDGISLVGRRAIDVAYFIVAQTDTDTPNRYYSRHIKDEFTTYVVDLEFFKWLMSYTSNNRNHLRSVLRQGQKAAVEITVSRDSLVHGESTTSPPTPLSISPEIRNQDESSGRNSLGKDQSWVSVPLMGTVGIDRNQIYFKVHAQLEPYIKSPLRSHFLDLRLLFDTLRGRVLYDRVQPYIQDGITPWFDVDKLRQLMDCTSRLYQEFRYFNSRALSKAVNDINTNSNLTLEVHTALEVGSSRQIGKIRFSITPKPKSELAPRDEQLSQLQERYRILVDEFGLNRDQVYTVAKRRSEWTDERIDQAIEYTRFKIKQGTVTRSVAGYFMKTIEEHYVLGSAMKTVLERTKDIDPLLPTTPRADILEYTERLHADWDKELLALQETGQQYISSLDEGAFKDLITIFYKSAVARSACNARGVRLSAVNKDPMNQAHPLWLDFCAFVAPQRVKKHSKTK